MIALNLLTEKTGLEARAERQSGKHVLDLPLGHFTYFVAERKGPVQDIVDFKKRGGRWEKYAFDDILHINTQSSSQWDGLRHMALQKEGGLYYNGVKHDDISEKRTGRNGIHSKSIRKELQRVTSGDDAQGFGDPISKKCLC